MPGNLVEEVEKLVRLRNMGELTEEIFVEAKERLLHGIPGFSDEFPDHKSFWESPTGIRVLYGVLYIAGMLLSFLLLLSIFATVNAMHSRGLAFLFLLGFLVISPIVVLPISSFSVWASIDRMLKPAILAPLKKEDIGRHRITALFEGFMFGVFFICNFIFASFYLDSRNIIIYMTIISAFLAMIVWKHTKMASQQYQISNEIEKLVRLKESGALTEGEFEAVKSLWVIKVSASNVILNWLLKRGVAYLVLGILLVLHVYSTLATNNVPLVILCLFLAIEVIKESDVLSENFQAKSLLRVKDWLLERGIAYLALGILHFIGIINDFLIILCLFLAIDMVVAFYKWHRKVL